MLGPLMVVAGLYYFSYAMRFGNALKDRAVIGYTMLGVVCLMIGVAELLALLTPA